MAYFNREQLKKLIEGRPKGSTEQEIVESLIKKGHTFDGIELIPVGVRMGLEPKEQQTEQQKGLFQRVGEFIGETTGFTGTTKAVGGALLGGVAADKIGRNVTEQVNALVNEAKKLPQGDLKRKQLLEQANRLSKGESEAAERISADLPSTKQALGSMGKLGLTAATFGTSLPASAVGRIAVGGAYGTGFGASNAMEQDKSTGDIIKEGAIGGAIGATIPAGIEGFKWAVKGVPKLLSYTSNTPDEVLQRQYDNPELSKKILGGVKETGATGVVDDINNAAKKLRTTLSKQWDEGVDTIIQNNTGKRVLFDSKDMKILTRVADDFGIDLPQNVKNVSVKEALELNKELNALLSKKAIRESAQGVIARKAKDILDVKLGKFEGVDKFLSNYSGEKGVLDAVVDIMKPWSTSPVTKSTALSRVKSIFNDNKPAFLSAIKDLEESTGIPFLTDKAAALNILQKSPVTGRSLPTQLIELIAFPITSPRSAGALSRQSGRIGQSKASQITRNIVSEGVRKLFR